MSYRAYASSHQGSHATASAWRPHTLSLDEVAECERILREVLAQRAAERSHAEHARTRSASPSPPPVLHHERADARIQAASVANDETVTLSVDEQRALTRLVDERRSGVTSLLHRLHNQQLEVEMRQRRTRLQFLENQERARTELTAFHEARLAAATNKEWRAKQAAKFEREFDVKERIFREKLYQLDVQHIDELDKLAWQQQRQLTQAGVPGFAVTQDRSAVRKQRLVLAYLMERLMLREGKIGLEQSALSKTILAELQTRHASTRAASRATHTTETTPKPARHEMPPAQERPPPTLHSAGGSGLLGASPAPPASTMALAPSVTTNAHPLAFATALLPGPAPLPLSQPTSVAPAPTVDPLYLAQAQALLQMHPSLRNLF